MAYNFRNIEQIFTAPWE